jgi:hypothetical protein
MFLAQVLRQLLPPSHSLSCSSPSFSPGSLLLSRPFRLAERLGAIPSFLNAHILKNLNVQFKSNLLMIIPSSASTSSLSDTVDIIFLMCVKVEELRSFIRLRFSTFALQHWNLRAHHLLPGLLYVFSREYKRPTALRTATGMCLKSLLLNETSLSASFPSKQNFLPILIKVVVEKNCTE